MSFILTYRKIFCSKEYFLLHVFVPEKNFCSRELFLFVRTFFVPSNIFWTWFHAKKNNNNNNNKGSLWTFEHCSRSTKVDAAKLTDWSNSFIIHFFADYQRYFPICSNEKNHTTLDFTSMESSYLHHIWDLVFWHLVFYCKQLWSFCYKTLKRNERFVLTHLDQL